MNPSPDFTKPVDIQAFFYRKLGACGCSDLEAMISVVRDLLQWMADFKERPSYEQLFGGNTGVFYLLAGMLDHAGLTEHGSSIRHPWLTDMGKQLLNALTTIPAEQIEESEGVAYDGATYVTA